MQVLQRGVWHRLASAYVCDATGLSETGIQGVGGYCLLKFQSLQSPFDCFGRKTFLQRLWQRPLNQILYVLQTYFRISL